MSMFMLLLKRSSSLFQMQPKGITIQMKVLDEYILVVLFVLFLKRVRSLPNAT